MKKLFSHPALVLLLGVMMVGLFLLLVPFNSSLAVNLSAAEDSLSAQSNRIILFIGIGLVAAALLLTAFVALRSRSRLRPHSEATTDGFATVPFTPGTAPANPLNAKDTQSSPTRPPTLSLRPQDAIAYLIGPGGQPIGIQYSDFSIGRHRDNHLVVNEPHVSRRHARIVMQHGHFMLCNLSQIGTVVNNTPVHKATILQGGEQIRIGTVDFRFTLPTYQATPSPTGQPS